MLSGKSLAGGGGCYDFSWPTLCPVWSLPHRKYASQPATKNIPPWPHPPRSTYLATTALPVNIVLTARNSGKYFKLYVKDISELFHDYKILFLLYWCETFFEIVSIFWQLSQQQNIFYLEINFLMLNCWFEIVIKQKFIVRTSHRPIPEMGMLGEKSFTSILKYFRWPSGIRPSLAGQDTL